jgi:alpha-L-fucosidase
MRCVSDGWRMIRVAAMTGLAVSSAWGVASVGAQSGGSQQVQSLAELNETATAGIEIPAELGNAAARRATAGGLPYESKGVWGMSPHATPEQVRGAIEMAKIPAVPGAVQETWQSVADNYEVPGWLVDGKLGIFIHFGLYSIPAHGSEWYEKFMYGDRAIRDWHIKTFGPLDQFGYKDFIPKFTLPAFDPNQWAEVFKASGAAWVMPTAEHHDGYSLWDSKANPFNSVKTGPHRDFVGELGKAVRAHGMKFGVTNHTIEHYDFIETDKIPADMKTDLNTPGYENFYWVNHSDERLTQFMAQWLAKNIELIDQCQPDLIWYDNGLNHRVFDPLKLKVAAYYYNKARQWGKPVTFTGKGTCWIAGGVQDFEGMGRVARELTDFPWMVHESLAGTWGYVEGKTRAGNPRTMIEWLVEVVSKNGVLALNVAPKGDGSIPEDQQQCLRAIGRWLKVNGEAIYGTRPWVKSGEGALRLQRGQRYSAKEIRFTTKGSVLYAILMAWPEDGRMVVTSLPAGAPTGKPTEVILLGSDAKLEFTQDAEGLKIQLPPQGPGNGPYVIRLTGLQLR